MYGSGKGSWNPGKKYTTLVAQIQDVLEGGEQRTVRDIYYALESRGHAWEYSEVKRAAKRGRRAGLIDPRQIVDASRPAETTVTEGWDNPDEFLTHEIDGIWEQYVENFWDEQDHYVEVWLEKQSLASVFKPICKQYNVRLEATRGDWSDSKTFRATKRLLDKLDAGKDVRILYFGDYNPSGYHAPVAILDTMEYYGLELRRDFPGSESPLYFDVEYGLPAYFEEVGGTFKIERVALTTGEVVDFDLPENPVPSSSDKDETIKQSFMKHVSRGRDTNIELNALKEFEREYLEATVRESIGQYIDIDAKQRVEERFKARREELASRINIG